MMPPVGGVPLAPALWACETSAARAWPVALQLVASLERLYLMSPVGVSCHTTTAYVPVQNSPTVLPAYTLLATRAVQVVHWALTVGSVIFCTSNVPAALNLIRT